MQYNWTDHEEGVPKHLKADILQMAPDILHGGNHSGICGINSDLLFKFSFKLFESLFGCGNLVKNF